jgi:putative zinc finger/helix-turn-helix YgiT family protein
MKSPITGKEMKLQKEHRKLIFRKEEFKIIYHYYVCEDSGKKFENEELANYNIVQVQNRYREAHNLPFVSDIKRTRMKYDLSARKMSEVLGFGTNTYRSYETGEVPSDANGKLIQIADDEDEFIKLVQKAGNLTPKEKSKIFRKIEAIVAEKKAENLTPIDLFYSGEPSIFNGYSNLNLNKAFAIIRYYSRELSPWKIQLNKLLFYTDFHSFKTFGYSLTGLQYNALPHGPAPNWYETLFDLTEKRGYVIKEYKNLKNGHEGEIFHPTEEHERILNQLTPEEVDILELIKGTYGKLKPCEISEHSHKELGWIENKGKTGKISYEYSFDLIPI